MLDMVAMEARVRAMMPENHLQAGFYVARGCWLRVLRKRRAPYKSVESQGLGLSHWSGNW